MRIITNWCPSPLKKALEGYGIKINVVRTNSILNILFRRETNHDLCYFARFAPPLIDKDLFRIRETSMPVVYGFHAPLKIDHPVRPSHRFYNLIMPLQAVRVASVFKKLHLLNLDDLKMVGRLGLAAKSTYLPLGTDISVFRPVAKSEEFTVIYASRASWNKGTDILVSSIIPSLVKGLPNIRIVIVNYGFLTHLYEQLKGFGNIHVLPYLPPSKFAEILASAHVLLFPSRYESYGLVVLDALASGVVPVAFNVRGFVRDVLLRDSLFRKFVVDYPKSKHLVFKVIELYNLWLRSPEDFDHLVKRARRLVTKFSWDNVSRVWSKVFKENLEKA